MEENILDGKYKISLDAIDINLLRTQNFRTQQSDETIPLWSSINLEKRRDYYEFEAYFERTGLPSEDSDSECDDNQNKHICHICNIDVPLSYLKEHQRSNKHKTCLAIANHALDRIKEHMTQGTDVPTAKTDTSLHFCGPCALVVKLKNKGNHEKSIDHAVSVIQDRMLNKMLMMYIDKDKFFNDVDVNSDENIKIVQYNDKNDKAVEKDDAFDDLIEEDEAIVQELDKDDKTTDPVSEKITDDVSYTVSNENKTIVANMKELTPEIDELNALEEYIKLVTNINKDQLKHSLSAVYEDEIEIKTMSGDRVNVSVDNFHGFYKVGEYVQCRVCRVLVDDKETHKMLPDHMEKIIAPIKNKHCVRQLNEIWNHCILCNEIIENVDVHIQCSELHNSFLIEAMVTKETRKKMKTINDNERVYCEVCNIKMPMSVSLSTHQRGMKHKLLLKQKQLFDNNEAKPVIHFHFKKSKDSDEVTCRICDVVVTNIAEHISDDSHNEKYKEILAINKIIYFFKDRVFCKVCQANMMEEYVLYHVDGRNHKNKLCSVDNRESNAVDSALSTETGTQQNIIKVTTFKKSNRHYELIHDLNQLRCKICDILIENDKKIAKTHRKCSSHIDHFMVLIEKNEIECNGKRLLCKLCKCTFRKRIMLHHINIKMHKSNLINYTNSLHRDSIVATAPVVEAITTVQPNKKLIEPCEFQNTFNLKETNCQQTINQETSIENTTTVKNEKEQTDSSEHTLKFEELVIKKMPKVKDEKCCLLNESDHVTSDNQNLNVINISSTKFGSVDRNPNENELNEVDKELDSPETTEMSTSEPVDEQNFTTSTNVTVKAESSTSKNELQDVVFRYEIESSDIPVEFIYKSSEEIVLTRNKLTKIDENNYFCNICTVLVPDVLKIDHIYCDDHKDKFNDLCQYSDSDESQSTNSITGEEFDIDTTCEMTQPTLRLNDTLQAQNEPTIKQNYTKHDTIEENNFMKASSVSIEVKNEVNSETDQSTAVNDDTQKSNLNITNSAVNEQKDVTASHIDSTYSSPPGNYIMETTKNPKKVICKACKITLPNTEENIKEHSDRLSHISNYNFVLSSNKLKKSNDNFYCECCYTCVTKSYAFLHIDSYIHKNNLMKVTSPILIPGIVKEEADKRITEPVVPTNDDNSKINVPKVQVHYMMAEDTANSKQIICKLCEVKVPYKNIDEHVTGFNHCTNYTSLLNENKLTISNNTINCDTCNVKVPEKGEFDHINGRNHQKNLSKNTFDQSKIPIISLPKSQHLHHLLSIDPTNPKFVICKICNVKVNHVQVNINEHLKGLLHTDNHIAFLLKNKLKRVNDNLYCELCRIHIPTASVLDHIEGNKHTGSVSNQVTGHTSKSINVQDQKELYYMLSIDTSNINQVVCKVCNVNVPYLARNIEEHINGSNHTDNYNLKLIKNKLKKVNELIHCDACNVNMSQKSELNHIISSTHITNLSNNTVKCDQINKDIINNKPALHFMMAEDIENPNQVICRVCKVKVPNSLPNIDMHTQGSKHSSTYKAIFTDNKLKAVGDKIRCDICNLQGPKDTLFNHINSNIHKSNYAKNKKVSSASKDTNTNIVRPDITKAAQATAKIQSDTKAIPHETVQNIVTKQRIHYLMNTTENPKELSCKICDCRVAIRNDLVMIHIEGSRHIFNYNSILDTHKMKKIADTYYCNVCTCFVVIGHELDHMNNKKHIGNLINYSQPSTSGMSSKTEVKKVENDTKSEVRTQSEAKPLLDDGNKVANTEKVHYLMQKTEYMAFVRCKICISLVENKFDSIYDHITSNEHNLKFNPFLNENKLHRVDNKNVVLCELCNVHIQYVDVFNHINDDNHKSKVNSRAESNEVANIEDNPQVVHYMMINTDDKQYVCCKICKILVPSKIKYITKHVTGPDHNAKFDPILNEHNIKRIDDNKRLLCERCDEILLYVNVFKHIHEENHKNNKPNVPKTKLTSNASKAEEFCGSCQIYVVNMKAHVMGQPHLEKGQMEFKSTYFCEICELELPNNADAIELHENGTPHKTEFQNILTENSIKIRDDRVCFCERCNLFFTKLSVLKHINSVKHKWFQYT